MTQLNLNFRSTINNFSVFPMQYLEYASAKNLFIWNSNLTRSPVLFCIFLNLTALLKIWIWGYIVVSQRATKTLPNGSFSWNLVAVSCVYIWTDRFYLLHHLKVKLLLKHSLESTHSTMHAVVGLGSHYFPLLFLCLRTCKN